MSRFFRHVFSDCAVASFVVRVETWVESSVIVFVDRATNVLSDCVVVARYYSPIVCSFCILVNNAALACADFTLAAYP